MFSTASTAVKMDVFNHFDLWLKWMFLTALTMVKMDVIYWIFEGELLSHGKSPSAQATSIKDTKIYMSGI